MASHLGMSLRKYMQSHTQAEHEGWVAWLDMQYDSPGLVEHYLMLVAAEVRRGYVKNPRRVRLSHMRLSFNARVSHAQAVKASKAAWQCLASRAGPRPHGRAKGGQAHASKQRVPAVIPPIKPAAEKPARHGVMNRTMWGRKERS